MCAYESVKAWKRERDKKRLGKEKKVCVPFFSFYIFCITLLLMSSVYFDFLVLILFLFAFILNEGTKRGKGRERR